MSFIDFVGMGEEINATTIPSFVKGKFMLLRVAPPKGKTIRDGLVATLGLLSYENDSKTTELVSVSKSTVGYNVEFPFGKRGIIATKYRGPKSWYRFFNNDKSKFYQIGKNDQVTKINDRCTEAYALEYLTKTTEDWAQLDQVAQNILIDEYFEGMYMFGLAKDFNLNVETKPDELPRIGMVTDFYRRYTPPENGEKYGNTIVTKFAPREGKETLSGEYNMVDAEIAAAILDGIVTNDATFDPASFTTAVEENSEEVEL